MSVVVKVAYHGTLSTLTGKSWERMELNQKNPTLKDLLETLASKYGKALEKIVETNNYNISPFTIILHNKECIIFKDGLNTRLREGDEIEFLLAVGGG